MEFWVQLVPLALGLATAAMATPVVGHLALAFGAIDRPNERKVSRRENIPLLGGIAVALGLYVGLAAGILLTDSPTSGGTWRPTSSAAPCSWPWASWTTAGT